MAIGERIRFLRNLHGAIQKWLGIKLGFSEKTAETRVGQYEIGVRTPKDDMIRDIAKYSLYHRRQSNCPILIITMHCCTHCLQ